MHEQQSIYYLDILIGALLIGIIITYFIVTIIRYHRRYIKLQKERIFAEITIRENERRRIATDLHDSLGPLLSAVKLNISSINIHHPEDMEIISKTGIHLDEIIGSMRQISNNLIPHTLERKGLAEAIREFIAQVNHKDTVKIQLFVMSEISVPKEKEIHIFRMIQEIVHNAIKHAHARTLQIGLSEEKGTLLLLSKDDGKGFDVDKEKANLNGLGLRSVESRVEILNGICTLESKPEQGTNYFIKIPLG